MSQEQSDVRKRFQENEAKFAKLQSPRVSVIEGNMDDEEPRKANMEKALAAWDGTPNDQSKTTGKE